MPPAEAPRAYPSAADGWGRRLLQHWHFAMVRDAPRNAAYAAALERAARALAASDDDVASSASPTPTPPSSDSPRAVGTTKRFPCPAGCDRFFTHAPAAVQHGKTVAAKPQASQTVSQAFSNVPSAC